MGHPVPSIQVNCTNHCKYNSSSYPHHYHLSVRPNQCRWSDRLLTNNPSIVAPATFLFAPKLRPIAPKLRAGHTAGSSAELPLCLAMAFLPSFSIDICNCTLQLLTTMIERSIKGLTMICWPCMLPGIQRRNKEYLTKIAHKNTYLIPKCQLYQTTMIRTKVVCAVWQARHKWKVNSALNFRCTL